MTSMKAQEASMTVHTTKAALLQPHKAAVPMRMFIRMTCRHCLVEDPLVFFAPVMVGHGAGTCLSFDCVKRNGWLTPNGDVRQNKAL